MNDRSIRIALASAGILILVAVIVMWRMQASRPSNIRPGIDVPWRGM